MAWISVHEQVIGGKLRVLSKKLNCSQNEALGMLVSLWLWGINNAEQDGMIIGATKEDVAKVLHIGLDNKIDPLKAVDALIETKWIDFDKDLYLHDWREWQKQWYKAMDVRKKDKERKQNNRAKKEDSIKQIQMFIEEKKEGIVNEYSIKSNNMEEKSGSNKYSKDFEEWWEVYPRKVGKGEAYKKYNTRKNDGWSPVELLEAAKNYKNIVLNERTESKYIKHPKTFLSDTTPFTDYIKKEHSVNVVIGNDDNPYAEWRK